MKSFGMKWKKNWRRRLCCSGIAGLIIGICLVVGYCIETYGGVPYSQGLFYAALVLVSCVLTAAVFFLFLFLDNRKVNPLPDREYSPGRKAARIFGYGGLILAGWIPSFLGVYPGWFNYDAPWQLSMYINHNISSHHPVLHTLILGQILESMNKINGTYNKGIALYLLLQMVILALCFGFAIYYMEKRNIGKIGRGLGILWFILFPTVVLHVMCTTKDSLFAGFFTVFCILSYELYRNPEEYLKRKWNRIIWVLLLFLCVVFRQNSLYVFLIAAIPFFLLLRKYRKQVIGMAVAAVALYLLYVGPFYSVIGVTPGSRAEFLSVPCQQAVKVYLDRGESLDEKEKEQIGNAFDRDAFLKYRPKLADYTKGNLKLDVIEKSPGEYLKLYFSMLGQFPDVCMDAFFLNNYGFWYPDATVDIYEDGVSYYFATEHVPPAVTNSKIPFLLTYYKNFYTGFPVQDAGPLTWILSMAFYFYLFVLSAMYAVYRKNKAGITVFFTVFLLWLTYLLGPAALVRYVFFLYVMFPLESVAVRDSTGNTEVRNP